MNALDHARKMQEGNAKKTITVHDTYFFTESYYKRGTNEEETNRQSKTDKD
jgi:hypothetical protein